MKFSKALLGGASFCVAFAPTALAQEEEASADEARVFSTVTVTAQKREQSLQDVPIVVTAVDGALLEDAGVRNIKDLTILTPGLLVTSSANESDTTARIRGIGTVGNNPGLESSVGVVIDGVSRARNGVSFGDLGEIERIEVLKGPQGTLFGKSTSAGVINIVTKAPENEFRVTGELTAGNYGLVRAAAGVTGPVTDTVSGRLYAVSQERDGYLDVNTGVGPRTLTEDNDSSFYSVRGQLNFEPTDDFNLRVIGDYTERDENCCAATAELVDPVRGQLIQALAGGQGTLIPPDEFGRTAFSNRDTTQETENYGISVEADWSLGLGDLTSITSFRSFENKDSTDSDYSGADIWYREGDSTFTEFETFIQEIRLAGSTDRLDWLVGAYFAQEDLTRNDSLLYGNAYFPYFQQLVLGATGGAVDVTPFAGAFWNGEEQAQDDAYSQEATTIAVFTHNTITVTDNFDITAGLRFTSDEKDLTADYNSNSGSCNFALANLPLAAVGTFCLPWSNDNFDGFSTEQDRTDEEFSGTLKGSYRANNNILTYASYARGYKAGGFNLDRSQTGPTSATPFTPVADTSFDPETVDAYEIGWKYNNDLGNFFFNGALFLQEYTDFQLNTFTGISFIVTSIPEVTSQGVDTDFRWIVDQVDGLSFQGGVTYAETQYGDFDAAAISAGPRLPNTAISFAPRWSGSLAGTYEHKIAADWDATWNLSARYTSRYNTGSNLDPTKDQDELVLINARLGFSSDDNPLAIEFWAQNLTDEDHIQVGFDTPLQGSDGSAISSFLAPPRTYGMTLRVDY